jgi:hypothetical protein
MKGTNEMTTLRGNESNRWFWIYVGNMLISGLVAIAALGTPAKAASHIVFNETEVEVLMPHAVPMGFQSFDQDVLLGRELEALEELEEETACAGFESSTILASRPTR